jgi:hypothetical protein
LSKRKHLHARVSYPVLESLVLTGLQTKVGRAKGLSFDEVVLTFREMNGRAGSFRLEATVSKWADWCIRTTVAVCGWFSINDNFELMLSGLSATSAGLKGVIGWLASWVVDVASRVQNILAAWEGRTSPGPTHQNPPELLQRA